MSAPTSSPIRFVGRISELSPSDRSSLFDRSTSSDAAIRDATAAIIAEVRRGSDVALRRLAERFDRVCLDALELSRDARRRALDATPAPLRAALEHAASNISAVHSANRPTETTCEPEPGIVVTRRPDPLARVGVYAPGGRAAYPSSVLMCAVPARVAGVAEVVLCSPPDASGAPSQLVLAAAEIANVDRVFALGGAGAIAAMAFGTETVPRVDRIVGPGNAYVAEAKLQLCGFVGIDAPAGPSELLLITDGSTAPMIIAMELAAQAEHDPAACAVAVVIGDEIAARIRDALVELSVVQPRAAIIASALASRGAVLTARDADEAVAFANAYAPEHLLVATAGAAALVPRLRNAGTVFVGASSSVAFGDYASGANHVLPTGGLARSYSGLSTSDFIRWTTIQTISPRGAASLAKDVMQLATAEGLPGHMAAALLAGGQPSE